VVLDIDDKRDQAAAQMLMFLRSLDPDQLELYGRTHPESASNVETVMAEREIRAAIWPQLLDRLGDDMAHAFWLNTVEIDDHQAALGARLTLCEVLEGAMEVTRRQFQPAGRGR
jgi:hypothetical protein